jgi:hypothetical protein
MSEIKNQRIPNHFVYNIFITIIIGILIVWLISIFIESSYYSLYVIPNKV